jgi:hypothetical protein
VNTYSKSIMKVDKDIIVYSNVLSVVYMKNINTFSTSFKKQISIILRGGIVT